MEDWAEIRRLHKSEGTAIKAIARKLGVSKNTVRRALASDTPPRYERAPAGSAVDEFVPQIRSLLADCPSMPATVIGERIGWTRSASVLRARVAELRPEYAPVDPADRTVYRPGEIIQCDLWFPPKIIPAGPQMLLAPPVLTMVAAFSGLIAALLLPSRRTGDLLAGMWQLLAGSFGAVPRMLVWDNEAGIGRRGRLTADARAFAGTLGTRIWQARPYDPETKGVVERANGFLQTSFLPGRRFGSPQDFNDQLAAWLPGANRRILRRTGAMPADVFTVDAAAMGALPPLPPRTGHHDRVRLARDYYVRVAGNDYSVHPSVIGRLVDITCTLDAVTVTCAGRPVAAHERCWATRQTITDPSHVAAAAELRAVYQARGCRGMAVGPRPGEQVATRALADYDALFAPATTPAAVSGLGAAS